MSHQSISPVSIATRDRFVHEVLALRNAMLAAYEEEAAQTFMLSGVHTGAGVTSVAVAAALGLCWDKRTKVVLIDGNFARPCLHTIFKVPQEYGLFNFVAYRAGIGDLLKNTMVENLQVITTGTATRSVTLNADAFARALKSLKEFADFVILDAAPIAQNPQLLFLGPCFDRVALVAQYGVSRRQDLKRSAGQFRQVRAPLMGVIFNKYQKSLPEMIERLLDI